MTINTQHETAVRREPRTFKADRPMPAPAQKTSDQAWPGFTRAQLRDHIIDQIG